MTPAANNMDLPPMRRLGAGLFNAFPLSCGLRAVAVVFAGALVVDANSKKV
jgi:hypothetical protein